MMGLRFTLSLTLILLGIGWLVDPRLVWGAIILFAVNVVVSFWLEYETDAEYLSTARASAFRGAAYVLCGGMSVTFAWMMRGIPGLNRGVFGLMAAVEFLVGTMKLARITPRLRPAYIWLIQRIDTIAPVRVTPERVRDMVSDE